MIDTHCHLNDPEAFPFPDRTLEEAREAGLTGAIVVGIDPASSILAVEIASRHADVWATVGCHPNYAYQFRDDDLEIYRSMLDHPKVIAVGEIGLDFHWDFSTAEQQERALEAQWDLAVETGKPIVWHCREAYGSLLHWRASRPAHPEVYHCFAGTADQAQVALEMGAYLGVDGPITYKKSGETRELFAALPRGRVLMGTDAPYLTPIPHRGKPNRPEYVRHVLETLAQGWHMEIAEAERLLDENARRLFSLEPDLHPRGSGGN